MAIALMVLKSSPASSNKLRACTPYSSTVRLRAVVKRQCATSSAPAKTPSEVFVFPTSITRSINEFLRSRGGWSIMTGKYCFNQIAGHGRTVLLAYHLAHRACVACIVRLAQQNVEFPGHACRAVFGPRQSAAAPEPRCVRRVVGLIESERHNQRGNSGAQSLCSGADTAMKDHHAPPSRHAVKWAKRN